jgi:hypothetical protein
MDRRNARRVKVEGMEGFKQGEKAPPRWGRGIERLDRIKLVSRLANVWQVPPNTVTSRLYTMDPRVIQEHYREILKDDPAIYTELAKQLDPRVHVKSGRYGRNLRQGPPTDLQETPHKQS